MNPVNLIFQGQALEFRLWKESRFRFHAWLSGENKSLAIWNYSTFSCSVVAHQHQRIRGVFLIMSKTFWKIFLHCFSITLYFRQWLGTNVFAQEVISEMDIIRMQSACQDRLGTECTPGFLLGFGGGVGWIFPRSHRASFLISWTWIEIIY